MKESLDVLALKDLEAVSRTYERVETARAAYTSYVDLMFKSLGEDVSRAPLTTLARMLFKHKLKSIKKQIKKQEKVYATLCTETQNLLDLTILGDLAVADFIEKGEAAERLFKMMLVQTTVSYMALHSTLKQSAIVGGRK